MAYENGKYTPPAFLDVNALMGGGFKIPDGYKGVVEDGVFRLVDTMDPSERIRENIILYFKNERHAQVGEIENKWIPWLEKQKEQKPAEWSEEDEKAIKLIESATWDGEKLTQGEAGFVHNWLKSHRPQPHWKPSEEQMDTLQIAYKDMRIINMRNTLLSLYNDLKKLC